MVMLWESTRRLFAVVFLSLVAVSLLSWSSDAEAGRLGGGRSSGIQRQITPPPAKPPQVVPQRPPQPAATPQPTPPRRSWLGPLAGIAAGLGLAWLFSSLGLSQEFGSLILIALFAAALFWLFRRLLSAREATPAAASAAGGPIAQEITPALDRAEVAEPSGGPLLSSGSAPADLLAMIDEESFVREAKRQFITLQAAHDAQDWDAIARLVTPELLADLRAHSAWEAGQRTEVVQLDAEVVDVADEGERYVVTLLFKGLLRERSDAPPTPFAEYWHLVKPKSGGGWKLAGIQPAEG
ncbi:TIM44-like domain-containing protein [Hydrogenophilus islandicus]